MNWFRAFSARILIVSGIWLACFSVAPVAFEGCKQLPTTSASENVVVNAEKTLRVSKDTFDIFLKLEYNHRDLVKSKFPQIHQFAEYIRKNAPNWLITANDLKNQYKHNGAGLQALLGALSILNQNTSQAQTYINTLNGH